MLRSVTCLLSVGLLLGCKSPIENLDYDVIQVDGANGMGTPWCETAMSETVEGARLPAGFCIRRFARVPEPRVLSVAANGDVFVSSPGLATPGGASGGDGSIRVLADDDHNGIAEVHTFLAGITDVHGIAVTSNALYYTTSTALFRVPYSTGMRMAAAGSAVHVADFPSVAGRWTHGVTVSAQGTVYVSQGVYGASTCPDNARAGGLYRVDGSTMTLLADGMRNPMYVGCHPSADVCLANEMGDDGGAGYGARERVVSIRENTHFGFPCCATTGVRAPNRTFDCSNITMEERSIPLFDSPFGLDWERGRWPLPFRDAFVIALHGSFYSFPKWSGARVAFATVDPVTRLPTGEFQSLLLGFGPGGSELERPADVKFGTDGRLFLADDHANAVYWIAPASQRAP